MTTAFLPRALRVLRDSVELIRTASLQNVTRCKMTFSKPERQRGSVILGWTTKIPTQSVFQQFDAYCAHATPRGSQNDLSTFDLRFRNVPRRGEKTASCSAEIVRDEHISKSFRYVSYPCQEFVRRIVADRHVVIQRIQKLLDF